jgi:hypothetical protein
MSDRLEDFVRQHREEFDLHEPDPSLWLKIEPAGIPAERVRKPMRWLRIAAAVALIFAGSSAGIYFLTGGAGSGDRYADQLYQEILETERYYSTMVSQRYEELGPFLASHPEVSKMLEMDMEELDAVYRELREDLKENVANPEVIEAMILNYRVKLEILEELLTQLKEKETQEYETNGSYDL